MRILFTIEFYSPSTGGAEEVIRQIAERLARRGHDVHVATSFHPDRKSEVLNDVRVHSFKISGNMVKGISGNINDYYTFLKNNKFDVIHNYAAQTWCSDLIFSILNELSAIKIFSPLGYSRLDHPKYANYFNKLPNYLSKYDQLLYTSPNYKDKIFGDKHGVGHLAVIIPNGASEEEFQNDAQNFKEKYKVTTRHLFLSVSNHYFGKGHNFVINAFNQLHEKNSTLVIIGERPTGHSWYSCYPFCKISSMFNPFIRVLNAVPRDLVISAYQQADLFLFGSKVECAPLVLYESFASNTPFVTRNVGNVNDYERYIDIVNRPEEMVQVMQNFLNNPTPYIERSRLAYELFQATHTWDKIAQKYETLYSELISKGK